MPGILKLLLSGKCVYVCVCVCVCACACVRAWVYVCSELTCVGCKFTCVGKGLYVPEGYWGEPHTSRKNGTSFMY